MSIVRQGSSGFFFLKTKRTPAGLAESFFLVHPAEAYMHLQIVTGRSKKFHAELLYFKQNMDCHVEDSSQ
jgi:hypothetical protein